jgi:putative ABC transport system permease protein
MRNIHSDLARESVRQAIREIDADVPASALRTMDGMMEIAVAPRRLNLWLVRFFGLSALILAAAGIYAITAFSVSSRTREMGIRAALGARPVENLRVVVTESATPLVVGLATGAFLSVAAAPALRALLFEVNPIAPGVLVAVTALLLVVGLSAASIGAWKITGIDPLVALRAD